MDKLSERIAGLPPDKRRLFAKLLAAQPSRRQSGSSVAASASIEAKPLPPRLLRAALDQAPPVPLSSAKEECRRFYDAVTRQLDSTMFGQFSYFLNYGYRPDDHPSHAVIDVPEHYINKNSVRLVLELIGDCPLTGRRVLDVGCGRGGTVHIIATMFNPETVIGLDLSPAAIAFCRDTHRDPRMSFFEGDAERLPFADESYDVVTNVESSHTYPDIGAFYAGVFRVLVPGGAFLYTDLQPVQMMTAHLAQLKTLGFVLEEDTDITPNVILSCDEIARNRVQAFSSANDSTVIQNFLATPESQVYGEMKSGRWRYRILRLRKPSA
jgi:phthiocerol/phenolphthiocerol synthesis type-I polyketide synthase E